MHEKQQKNNQELKDEQEVQGESEQIDFEKPDFHFEPKEHHEWRQRGYYIICKSCELEHAVWVGSEVILVGISETGQPIFKKRSELFKS